MPSTTWQFPENSSKGSYGVHNNAFMDRQMDGWMDEFHADSYIP